MNVAYVAMVEDATSGFVSTAQARAEIDAVLNDVPTGIPLRPADRDSWLRGGDAARGQAAMLDLAGVARRGR